MQAVQINKDLMASTLTRPGQVRRSAEGPRSKEAPKSFKYCKFLILINNKVKKSPKSYKVGRHLKT